MKTMLLLLTVAMTTACGPYYIGRKPVDPAEELLASIPEVPAQSGPAVPDPVPSTSVGANQPTAAAQPLIGWDGKEISTDDIPLHGIEGDANSRNYVIDLYVKSKEREDELETEVMSLHDLLASQEQLIGQRDQLLNGERDQVTNLEAELAAERARNADLEARLVTAQIRRLEAERQLLLTLLGTEEVPAADTTVA
ncbi:MAG: hypothetical protein GY884_26465, partial [Proteobacteria bacterium]|nr:hypothetical protein [Pseudomonadota bacterium]